MLLDIADHTAKHGRVIDICELTAVSADIDKYVETTRAKWVTEGGIDEEWDAYIEQLKTMGLEQLVQIYTDAYERYTAE